MHRQPRPSLASGFALGLTLALALRASTPLLGAAPATQALALAGVLLAAPLGARLPVGSSAAARAPLAVGYALCLSGLIFYDNVLHVLPAELRIGLPLLGTPLLLGGAGLCWGALGRGRSASALTAILGFTLGSGLLSGLPGLPAVLSAASPALALPLGLAAIAGLAFDRPGPARPASAPLSAIGALLVGFAFTTAGSTLRVGADTGPGAGLLGGLAFAFALALSDAALRRSPVPLPASTTRGLVIGAAVCLGVAAVLPFGVGINRLMTLPLLGAELADLGLRADWALLCLGAVGGVALALAAPPGGPRGAAAALGAALCVPAAADNAALLVPLALAATAALLLFPTSRWGFAQGVLGAGGLLALTIAGRALPIEELTVGQLRSLRGEDAWSRDLAAREQQTPMGAGLSARGAWAVRGLRSTAENSLLDVELDGRIRSMVGRAAEAERLAGALAGVLSPRRERALLLGDDAGNVILGMEPWPFDTRTVAVPAPEALRAAAAEVPRLRAAWLAPGTRLRPAHPSRALRESDLQDVIVEVFDAGWPDGAHPALSAAEARAAAARLRPDGVYIAVLHLDLLADGDPATFAAGMAEAFPAVQAWLPPTGADALLLVGSASPLPLRRLEAGYAEAPAPLRALGFASAGALASRAIVDGPGLRRWAESAPRPVIPSGAERARGPLTARPFLHLAPLAGQVAGAASLWDLSESSVGVAVLEGRLDLARRYLKLLGGAAQGDMKGVFQAAKDLSAEGDPEADRALASLIEPQLQQARAALARARVEGPTAGGWEEASRAATTARLLAPTHPEPLLILAEVSLAQGNLKMAEEQFTAALALDEASLSALFGLARVARARGELPEAEARRLAAARLHPRVPTAWLNLGVFWMEQGRLDEAEGALGRAAGMAAPDDPGPSLALGELALRRGQASAALVHAERAVLTARAADAPRALGAAHFLRGRAYYAMDQLDRAEDDLRNAVLLDGQLVAARGGVGELRARKGDLKGAIEAFKLVLQLDPDNVPARENLREAERQLAARDAQRSPGPPAPGAP
jgi:tetratricopeptide (TPR) repeat protein